MRRYKDIPIRDNHVHVWREIPLGELTDFYSDIFEKLKYKSMTFCAISREPKNAPEKALMPNLKSMYLKKKLFPKVFTYAGPHMGEVGDKLSSDELLRQAELYYNMGFDGIKLFYNYRVYVNGYPHLSDGVYDMFFEFLEKKGFPITLHLGAPEPCFGKPEEVSDSQKKWCINNPAMHLYEMFDDFIKMMDKFPKLKIVVAHFAFITEHIDWAEEWLNKYENLYFDLTPSLFMYFDFQKNKKAWTDFFIKYQDRIIYGTDIGSNTLDLENKEPDALCHVVRGFFEETEDFEEFGETFSPMPLPDEILKKIYHDNMLKLYPSDIPREINAELLKQEFDREEKNSLLTPLAKENFDLMKEEFGL